MKTRRIFRAFFFISLLLLILLSSLPTKPAWGDLTKADLEQIREIVKESEAQLEAKIDLKLAALDSKFSGKIEALDSKLSGKIESLDQRLSLISGWVYALVALITGAIVLPQLIIAFKEKGSSALQERISRLEQEIADLKNVRYIPNPDINKTNPVDSP